MLPFSIRTLALKRVCGWHQERVLELQHRRLSALLRHAKARSPYYQRLYKSIDPDKFELGQLPITNKSELMSHFDDVVTDRVVNRGELEKFVDDPENEGRWYLGKYAVSHTSGSQGQPLLIVCNQTQLELVFGVQMTRGNVRPSTPLEAARRVLNPARLAVVTLKRGFYPSASAFEYMPNPVRRYMRVLRLSQTDDDLVEQLNAYRPTALTAYASVLEMLALEAEAGRLRLAPELIQLVNNSESLTTKARERIEKAFGLHVLNNYATGECPFLTIGCRAGHGAHVNADWAILEVVDSNNRPVEPGTPGAKVLVTNLVNRLQPFIRYEIGDVVTMADEPCKCGNRLPLVARIDGRASDTFWVQSASGYKQLINSVFKNAFDYTREVREWQAVQTARNEVLVRLELLPGRNLDEPHAWWSLHRQLEMYGFRDVLKVALEVVPSLKSDPRTGKFRRMISQVGPPPEQETIARLRFDAPQTIPAPRVRIGVAGTRAPFDFD
jgi:phenylacetate-coenzyme A ligase PaaK-like adenylate-forming protein